MEISDNETTKRALACEAAIADLVMRLVDSETIPTSAALELLRLLSLSSHRSTERLAGAIEKLERLKVAEDKAAKS